MYKTPHDCSCFCSGCCFLSFLNTLIINFAQIHERRCNCTNCELVKVVKNHHHSQKKLTSLWHHHSQSVWFSPHHIWHTYYKKKDRIDSFLISIQNIRSNTLEDLRAYKVQPFHRFSLPVGLLLWLFLVLLFLNIHKSVVNEARSCALRTKSSSLWLALWRSLIYVLCYSSFLCVLWFVELIAIIFVKYVPKPSPHTHTHLFKIRFNIIQNI